jgi:hypothetical protein
LFNIRGIRPSFVVLAESSRFSPTGREVPYTGLLEMLFYNDNGTCTEDIICHAAGPTPDNSERVTSGNSLAASREP